jgi:hypothetical protein
MNNLLFSRFSRRNPCKKKGKNGSNKGVKSNVEQKSKLIINVTEPDDGNNQNNADKYFNNMINEIPFIDDSKYNSRVDLTRNNPYQPLTNNI